MISPRHNNGTGPHAGLRGCLAHRHGARTLRAGCGVVLAACALQAHGANLRANNPIPGNGGTAVPIYLTPNTGDQIASMQFRLQYDTARFSVSHVDAGAAASGAGKSVVYAEHDGSATIIIAGLNQDPMNGGIVATVYLSPLGSESVPQNLGIGGTVFSDPGGNAVAFNELPTKSDPGSTDSNPEKSPPPSNGEDTGETPATPTTGDTGGTPTASPGTTSGNNRNYYPDYSGTGGYGGNLRADTSSAHPYPPAANAANAQHNTTTGVPIPMGGPSGGYAGGGSADNAGYVPSPVPGGPQAGASAMPNHRPGMPVAARRGMPAGNAPLPNGEAPKNEGRTKVASLAPPPIAMGDDSTDGVAGTRSAGAIARVASALTGANAPGGFGAAAALLGVVALGSGAGLFAWRRSAKARR